MGSSWWNSKREDRVKELIKNPSKFYEGSTNINRKHIQGLIDEYHGYKSNHQNLDHEEENNSTDLKRNSKQARICYEDLYIGNYFMFKELFIKEGNKSKNISKLLSRKKKWDIMANFDPSKSAY